MPEVIVYIDDICVITKGSFQDHLKVLEEVSQIAPLNKPVLIVG